MQYTNTCTICGASNLEIVRTGSQVPNHLWQVFDTKFYGGEFADIFSVENIQLRYCAACSHYSYLNNFTDQQLARMYEAHYKHKKISRKSNDQKRNHFISKILLSLAKRKKPASSRLLDFGSGAGRWSAIASELGFNVVSYEPHSDRSELESQFQTPNWSDVKKEKYDVIICNQTLEHVVDPVASLKLIRSVANKNAVLFSSTPNAGRMSKTSLVQSWPWNEQASHIMAPLQHLQGFSQKSLILAHEKAGFAINITDLFDSTLHSNLRGVLFLLSKHFDIANRTGFIFRA